MFVKYNLGFLSLIDMHHLVFGNFLKNQNLCFLKDYVGPFLEEKISKIINIPVYNHLKYHLAKKNHVILMSSSPDFLVGPLAKLLNIKNSFATSYLLDKSGNVTGIDYFLEGRLKAQFLDDHLRANKLECEKVTGFSDSIDDLPLLERCSEVYLVNPSRDLIEKFIDKPHKII